MQARLRAADVRLHTGRCTARRAAVVVTAAADAPQGPSANIADRCVALRHIASHSSVTSVSRCLGNPERAY